MSVCLSVCLSVCQNSFTISCLSVCLSVKIHLLYHVCLSVCLSVRLSKFLYYIMSVCLSVRLSKFIYYIMSVCLSVRLSKFIYYIMSVCLSVCLSVYSPVRLSHCTSFPCFLGHDSEVLLPTTLRRVSRPVCTARDELSCERNQTVTLRVRTRMYSLDTRGLMALRPKGRFGFRRTLEYLESGRVYLKDNVKTISVHYKTHGVGHRGLQ